MKKIEDYFSFPIAKNIKYWIILPLIIIVLAGIMFGVYTGVYHDVNKGMNIGIDFAGGSLITVKLGDKIENSENYNKFEKIIREALESEDVAQKIVEYGVSDDYKNLYNKTIEIPQINAKANVTYTQTSGAGEDYAIVLKYDNISKKYDADNTLSTKRNELIKTSITDALALELNDYEYDEIEDLITYENIGPSASLDLIKTALLCLGISLIIILLYIIIRFEIFSGIAAVIGLLHDILMLVSLTIIFHIQVNSAFVAAIITIVSYSINNTIVVFDRLRENLKNEKTLSAKIDNAAVIDKAVRQTVLRSINSTITTMVAIVLFAILGSSTVNEFALPVIFGLIAGFYSSLLIAPSLYYQMIKNKDMRVANKLRAPKKKESKEEQKPKYAGAK